MTRYHPKIAQNKIHLMQEQHQVVKTSHQSQKEQISVATKSTQKHEKPTSEPSVKTHESY